MLGLIIYLVATVIAGFVLSFFVITFRSAKARGDTSPYFRIAICMFITILGPFMFVEGLTKFVGKQTEKAIKTAYNDGPINGKMQYFKLTWYTGKKATALVVGEERTSWGGTDRPVMGVNLEKQGDTWKAVSYHVIYSDRLNKDGLVLPPYK